MVTGNLKPQSGGILETHELHKYLDQTHPLITLFLAIKGKVLEFGLAKFFPSRLVGQAFRYSF
jgi:hypothetical protein